MPRTRAGTLPPYPPTATRRGVRRGVRRGARAGGGGGSALAGHVPSSTRPSVQLAAHRGVCRGAWWGAAEAGPHWPGTRPPPRASPSGRRHAFCLGRGCSIATTALFQFFFFLLFVRSFKRILRTALCQKPSPSLFIPQLTEVFTFRYCKPISRASTS